MSLAISFPLDNPVKTWYTLPQETVDAEIKPVMPPQRARGAGNRAGNRPANGPLRARRTAETPSIP